ncbi:DUF3887 domain-containing protein [Streptomyces sp. NPDC059893]|uniref:DUF3887 domain-containing protein n=1 Tax=Streptomyces sp. NPDC059893 TaxID=3346990 RepID=UPI003664415E
MSEDAPHPSPAADTADREVMGLTLKANAELLAGVLLGSRETGGDPVLSALAASRGLNAVVDDIQRALVRQARSRGLSWAAIGDVLHVTRQAAFQRFGGTADISQGAQELPGAAEAAMQVLEHFVHQRWDEMRSGFDTRMAQAAPADMLRGIWSKSEREFGPFQEMGTPTVRTISGYTVVDIPVAHERGDMVRRVVLNADGQVAGFFVLRAETE